MRQTILTSIVALTAIALVMATSAAAFEIITEEDVKQNTVPNDVFIRLADNFIVLYDASGSMADEFKDGIQKLDAEIRILRQQNIILPELGYNAGLYMFTPFKTYHDVAVYDRMEFQRAIDQLPTTETAGSFKGQPTPLAEGITKLDPILANLSGKTAIFIFTDGTYTFNRVTKQRPLEAAKALAAKYNVCFYLISSATTPKAKQYLDDMAAINECSRVIPFDALYDNPVWTLGTLYVVKSTVSVETVTDKKVMGVKVRDINFAWDQKAIKPGDHENLKQVAEFLIRNPKAYVVLAGFTDSTGDPEYNLKLSRMRAESAKNYLLEETRIDQDRVIVHWYGATNFIADNDTEEGRFKNRRVEIAIGFQK
jgi:OOP family OmpA-OmpF porin